MRNFTRLTMISAIVAAMFFNAYSADAQTRRATSTNSNGTTATRSSSSSSSSDNKASRSAGTVTATSRSNSASANTRNNTSATDPSSSTQTRRATTTGTARTNTTGTTANDRNRNTATSTTNRAAGTTTATSRTNNTAGNTSHSAANTTTEHTAAQQQTGTAARGGIRATSHAGLTSSTEMQERNNAAAARPSTGVTASANKATGVTRQELNYAGKNSHMNMDNNRNLNRVPPRDRDYMTYDRLGMFYGHDPHYFGYKIHTLPPSYRRIRHMGIDYYYYNNVYYRHYGSYYVVCRPPFGVTIDYVFSDVPFRRVRFSYYHNVYRAYDRIDSNYRTIMEQNRIIAQNNARIAQQNRTLALNSSRATSSYEIATALGLVQSYAGINTDYYYEDGVFYTVNKKGRYEVIVPPAGALVDELPDDYDVIVLNGVEYYKVDDTVYRLVLVDGIPCLEVLGQMYGSMARKYNYYYR